MTERCARHDLARGPGGECVVCRRERLSSAAPPAMRDGRKLLAFCAGAAVITLAAGGLAVRRAMPPDPAPRPVPVAETQTTRASETRSASQVTPTPASEARDVNVPITVYTTSWCPVCKRAKQWLAANEIPFTERDVEADPQAARDRRALTSERGVPTIDVDGEVLVGFDRQRLTQMIADARKRRL